MNENKISNIKCVICNKYFYYKEKYVSVIGIISDNNIYHCICYEENEVNKHD